MVSDKKREANRNNAKNSTGPKSERGRAASRQNAVKHGGFAIQRLLQGEDTNEYQQLSASVIAESMPKTVIESMLVDQIIGDMWRLKRIERAQVAHLEQFRSHKSTNKLMDMSRAEFAREKTLLDKIEAEFIKIVGAELTDTLSAWTNDLTKGPPPDLEGKLERESSSTSESDQAEPRPTKQELVYDDQMGNLLLQGMALPDKAFPYTNLDHIRRSLVRDITRNYVDLAKMQQHRLMIEGPPRGEI